MTIITTVTRTSGLELRPGRGQGAWVRRHFRQLRENRLPDERARTHGALAAQKVRHLDIYGGGEAVIRGRHGQAAGKYDALFVCYHIVFFLYIFNS